MQLTLTGLFLCMFCFYFIADMPIACIGKFIFFNFNSLRLVTEIQCCWFNFKTIYVSRIARGILHHVHVNIIYACTDAVR